MLFNQSRHPETVRSRRWPVLAVAGLLVAGLAVAGFQSSARNAAAQDGQKKSIDEIQEEALKALESLKKGPGPKKEDNLNDLNPIDQMQRAEDALKKAQKELQANPKSDEARKAVEEATKKYQESMKSSRPNVQVNPIAPIDPEDLNKEIERFNKEVQQMMQEMHRQMQGMPLQPGAFPGGRLVIGNRFPLRNVGDVRLGVRVEKPTAALSDQLDLPANMGLVVSSVFPDTPAAIAGLKPNDIILEIGGKAVTSDANELQRLVREFKADEKVNIVLMRKGKKETLKDVKLPEAKPEQVNPFQPLIVPRLQIPNLNFPFPPEAFGGQLSAMSITRNNGNFTIDCTEGATKYTVTGVKDEGPAKVTSIEVNDDGKVVKAESLEKLDAKYRSAVEKMLKSIR